VTRYKISVTSPTRLDQLLMSDAKITKRMLWG